VARSICAAGFASIVEITRYTNRRYLDEVRGYLDFFTMEYALAE
jgi:hypothetical protein